jgi:hypothetical protein
LLHFNRMVGFQFRIFMYSDSVQIKDNNWSQASTKCPWRVLAKSKTKESVPVQPSGRAFEGVWTPSSVLQINIENVWTSEQHRPDARSISIQQGLGFQKSTLFEKSLQAVWMTWQHVRTMSSILEYFRVPFERGKDFSKDRLDARSSLPDVNPTKIELLCFWKDIAENLSDVANFRPDARRPESESQQFLRSL